MSLLLKFRRWLWAGGAHETQWARERQLPFWEHPWFNRVYRIAFLTGWAAIILFFLLWHLWWATG